MEALVCNANGWTDTIDMDRLRSIPTPSLGPRHNPVNHGEMLERFRKRGEHAGIKISAEQGLLSPDGKRYMYVADTIYDSLTSDYAMTVGFINFNDKTRSFTCLAGQRVSICTNLCITGMLDDSRTRHSTNVEGRLDAKIDTCFTKFDEMFKIQMANVDAMKATKLTDELLGKFILWSTRKEFMGAANIRRIIQEVDEPTLNNKADTSMWRLHNAATFVLRENVKNPILVAESTKMINEGITALVR